MLIILFLTFKNPFFLVLLLIIYSILNILLAFIYSQNWIRYILILVYLGGLLVIYLYISSIIPNILINNTKIKILFLRFLVRIILIKFCFFLKTSLGNINLKRIQISYLFSDFFILWFLGILFLLILTGSLNLIWKNFSPIRRFYLLKFNI